MTERKTTLGDEVRHYRNRADLSQEALAEKLGITREAVSAIERGKVKRPDDFILRGFEEYLGLSRQRTNQLIGSVPGPGEADQVALIYQLAAIEDEDKRADAWYELPPELRRALMRLMAARTAALARRLEEES